MLAYCWVAVHTNGQLLILDRPPHRGAEGYPIAFTAPTRGLFYCLTILYIRAMNEVKVNLLRHQQQFIQLPWQYPELQNIFLIGGYSCGKSFSLVAFIIDISRRYNGHHLVCGIGSPTIVFFRRTVLQDLEKILIECGIKYRHNQQDNFIQIGTIKWVIINISNPKEIYGLNLACAAVDELDELEISRANEAFQAIQERVRIPFPDGRRPFSVFASTAQGLKGLYAITENLKERKQPYAIIRGHTRDNTNLPTEYYQRLYDLYNENERAAYLAGAFISLASGKVYPGYDPVKNTVEDFEINENDEIAVGLDFNIAASCATAIVKRDKKLYVVKEWQFKDFSQSAKEIRNAFPVNRIYVFPDSSGRMIIAGYMAEFSQHGIEVRLSPSNPPIVERIFLVNKMLSTEKMFRFKSCKNLDMAWKTRVYTEHGDPEKSKVHPAPDDCNDSHEYATFRILSDDPDFFDLYSLTRSYQRT